MNRFIKQNIQTNLKIKESKMTTYEQLIYHYEGEFYRLAGISVNELHKYVPLDLKIIVTTTIDNIANHESTETTNVEGNVDLNSSEMIKKLAYFICGARYIIGDNLFSVLPNEYKEIINSVGMLKDIEYQKYLDLKKKFEFKF